MTTKSNLFASWTKALSLSIQEYIKSMRDEITIEDFNRYDDGFLVTVAKVDYYIFNETLALELDMTVNELKDYLDVLEPYEVCQMLNEHWHNDEATELFISDLREVVSLSIKCNLMTDQVRDFVNEFESDRKKMFSLYQVVSSDESFEINDKYFFEATDNDLTSDFAEFRISYVSSQK